MAFEVSPQSNNAAASKVNTKEPLYSEFAGDPDMQELLDMFVSELPDRVAAIEQAVRASDKEAVKRLSHQLKGAAGGYGFMSITDVAAQVEQMAKAEKSLQEMNASITELISLCRWATSKSK